MVINIRDLDSNKDEKAIFLLSSSQEKSNNMRELSEQELKISGGAANPNFRTVIVSDDDLDVYFIGNPFPTNFVYNPDSAQIKPGRRINPGQRINVNNGNVTMRRNGDLDITFSDSDFSSSSSSS